jgi:hypothetical protein
MAQKHDINSLNQLYTSADECDKSVFAEQRSSLLLISGEHYSRKYSNFHQRLRSSQELSEQQRLRLTKNHIQNIHKIYVNHLVSASLNVGFSPKNPSELQDQKEAELNHSVWMDGYNKYDLEERIHNWSEDFFGVGEVATKLFYDPTGGKIKGWQPEVDEMGQPVVGEDGQPVKGEPVYEGGFVFEEVFGFNLLRAPEARTMDDSPYLVVRKMVDIKVLEDKYELDETQKKKLQESYDQTYVIFDTARADYVRAKNQALVLEYYFRPCGLYPMGYFYHTCSKAVVLAEGELPGGIFPIIFQSCDRRPTTPRGHGPVKTMRPYQAEINRSASKIAEHQITLGDDKLIIQNGSKASAGVSLPGVRTINVTGSEPTVMPGRDGSQYLNYMLSQIEELYRVMGVREYLNDANDKGQMDPYAMLFKSSHEKRRFQIYIRRFERFLIKLADAYLRLSKIHLPDDALIEAVGKKEMINIAEFKESTDLGYEITIEAQSDDLETKMGQQLVMNHLLQYSGQQLGKEEIGKIIKSMPYANVDESFSDLTLDYEAATNDILALDRGELPPVNQYDTHPYMIKRLTNRMRQPDFQFLNPAIQKNYAMKLNAHEEAEAARMAQLKAAESEFIPTGGYLVACDLYVQTDPQNPEKTKRARIPYQALQWLMERLESQGASQEELAMMNEGAQADLGQKIQQQGVEAAPNGQPVPMQ